MQRFAVSLSRSARLLRDSKYTAKVQACWLDDRNYSFSFSEGSPALPCNNKSSIEGFQNDSKSRRFTRVEESPEVLDQSSRRTMLPRKKAIGENISSREKSAFLLNQLNDVGDSREAVYGALDAWVAWEKSFPLVSLKRMLITLEKQEQWHRVVQIIKWMLSKGQGRTRGTYEQLIRALEKDHRAEEAHLIWVKKLGSDLHSVPWSVCGLMMSIYCRNNMSQRLIKLFRSLESFDRKPPTTSIIRKVADAYENLGLSEEKNKVLEKYGDLFAENGAPKKSRRPLKKREQSGPTSEKDTSGSTVNNA
ncbi:PPR containing-like protein [Wolffia australiana]